VADGRDNKGRFAKGNPGKQHGTRNKTNIALSQAIAAGSPTTPLAVMLEAMIHYRKQWLKAEEGPERRFAAELMLSAARQAAPYCHPRKVIIEEETVPVINVVDRRQLGYAKGHGGSNGSNGHGGNGSNGHGGNGHGGNGSTNGHGGNGNGSDHGTVN
jgi:hypothetical protein